MNHGYHKKKKKNDGAKVAAVGTQDAPATTLCQRDPERDHEGPMPNVKTFHPPLESRVGVWTVLVAVIVAVIYWFQLLTMDKSLAIDQRAWVGVVKVNQFEFERGPNFSIPFDVTNSGKTPALHVRSVTSLKSLEKSTAFVATYEQPRPIKPSYYVIQPQMHMTLWTLPTDVSDKQFDDISNGRGILYGYGEIVYEDVFGKEHKTEFCIMYWSGLPGPVACDTYNTAN